MSKNPIVEAAKRSPFQSWAQEQMVRLDMNPGDIHRALISRGHVVTEGYIYRLVQGKTAPKSPGYNLVLGIGEVLGDPKTALRLAGFAVPEVQPKIVDEKLTEWIGLFPADTDERDRYLSLIRAARGIGKGA